MNSAFSPSYSKSNNYIKGFDGIRAIAVLIVIVSHNNGLDFLGRTDFMTEKLLPSINALAGVNIFFVLSGYLITEILIHEKTTIGKINFKYFYARRALRLLPALFIFLLITGLLMFFGFYKESFLAWIMSATFTTNFIPRVYNNPLTRHNWSLAVEEQFYLIWPICIHLFTKYKLFSVLLFSIALCLVGIRFLDNMKLPMFNNTLGQIFSTKEWFFPAAAPIAIGCLAKLISMYWSTTIMNSKLFILVIGVLFHLSLFILPNSAIPYRSVLFGLGTALVLLYIVYNQRSVLVRVLEFQPFRYIGRISYGLYLYQGIFITAGSYGRRLWFQNTPLNLFLTFILAILSYEFVEKFFLRMKSNFK